MTKWMKIKLALAGGAMVVLGLHTAAVQIRDAVGYHGRYDNVRGKEMTPYEKAVESKRTKSIYEVGGGGICDGCLFLVG
jgi:hypothetical protein